MEIAILGIKMTEITFYLKFAQQKCLNWHVKVSNMKIYTILGVQKQGISRKLMHNFLKTFKNETF